MALRRKPIAAVLGVALALRLAAPLLAVAVTRPAPQFHEPDTAGYLRVAEELFRIGWFGAPGQPEIVRTPGYPLLLVAGVAAGHVNAVTVGLQIALSCATVWFVYRASLLLFANDKTALAAGWLMACEPLSIIYASKLLTETLFTTLVAAVLWLLARFALTRRWRDLLAVAIVMAASAYVRPIAYFLPPLMALALVAVFWRQDAGHRRLLSQAAAFVVVAMALLVPWQIRNLRMAGYRGFAAISDVNLYYYEAVLVLADQRGIPPEQWDRIRIDAGEGNDANYLRQHPEQVDWPPARRFQFMRSEAVRIIRGDPLRWARLHFAGVFHTLSDTGRNAWLAFFRLTDTGKLAGPALPGTFWQRATAAISQKPLVLAIHSLLAAILLVYLLLALIGLASPASRTPGMLLALAVGVWLLLPTGGAGYHRFRVPLVPVICMLAAQGYCSLVGLRRKRHA